MPFYPVECSKCGKEYEVHASMSGSDEAIKEAKCECGSKKKTRIVTAAPCTFVNPEGTRRWINTSTGHDYRYHAKALPAALKQREAAEKFSKTKNPYRQIDDISSGKHFGEVK